MHDSDITPAGTLEQRIVACQRCPRLLQHCQSIAQSKKKMFAQFDYWGKPVPNFGRQDARLIIVGLAPAAHGANRTGRMFTGDQSGVWLYRALHRAGFANQATSEHKDDGLTLKDCLITAVCHCAPPDNKPLPAEIAHCSAFLTETLALAHKKKIILALGQIAWNAVWDQLAGQGLVAKPRAAFAHAALVRISSELCLMGSYHPSQQNTFTRRLTEQAFDQIFTQCRDILSNTTGD